MKAFFLKLRKSAFPLVILVLTLCLAFTGCQTNEPSKEEETQESTQAPIYDTSPNSDYSLGKKLYSHGITSGIHYALPADFDLENNQLYITQYQKRLLGELTPIELTPENFDTLFATNHWFFGDSAEKIRENNESAWLISSHENIPQYLLKQKNSNILLLIDQVDITKDDEKVLIAEHVYQLVPNVEGQPSVYEQIILEFFNDPSSNLGALSFNDGGSPYSGYHLYFYMEDNHQICTMSPEQSPVSSIIGPIVRFDYTWDQEKIIASKDGKTIFTLTHSGSGFIFTKDKSAAEKIQGVGGQNGSYLELPSDGTFFVLSGYYNE